MPGWGHRTPDVHEAMNSVPVEPALPCTLPTDEILGLPICSAGTQEVVDELCTWARSGRLGRYVLCMNPHSFECARRLPVFQRAVLAADLLIPDGIGVVLASRLRGGAIRERVCGPDIFQLLSARLNTERDRRVFFLGGTSDALDKVVARYRHDFPHVTITGWVAPPFMDHFTPELTASLVAMINAHEPDVLWVGLGSPKQEIWTGEQARRIRARVIAPIGAAFDFFAGTRRLPPPWIQRCGLQWLHRLAQEPGRLWRRNLDSPIFLARAVLARRGTSR